jgi:hypothetical protein
MKTENPRVWKRIAMAIDEMRTDCQKRQIALLICGMPSHG